MIEIKCAADKTAAFNERCGILADTAFEMTERGETIGYSLVIFEEAEAASIVWLEAPDAPLTDALLRATLNALLAQGVKRAWLKSESLCAFAVYKGYLVSEDSFCLEIREFFSKTACKG